MSDWRTRLKAVISEKGYSLPEVANMAKYDYVTFWKALIKEQHNVKRETMNRICQALDVDPDYIWYGHEGLPLSNVPLLSNSQILPWLDDKNAEDSFDRVGSVHKIKSAKAFAWRSMAMDMAELVPLDSIVFFNPDMIPRSTDLVLAQYRDSFVFRRYIDVADEKYLMAINTGFPPILMGHADRVLAIVVGFYTSVVDHNRMASMKDILLHDDGVEGELVEKAENKKARQNSP